MALYVQTADRNCRLQGRVGGPHLVTPSSDAQPSSRGELQGMKGQVPLKLGSSEAGKKGWQVHRRPDRVS